jgi:eukaryotic-like serine/threonine-protein kinase
MPAWRELFDAASVLPPGPQRQALLSQAMFQKRLSNEELSRVLSLLQHHDAAQSQPDFLAAPRGPLLTTEAIDAALHLLQPGQRLGAWEVVRRIGVGGMGEVFEVRRADGSFEGRAAVKLLKRGMDSTSVLQRFALERQALARLNHPHIARLLDAGASAEGLPYFVMEYVQGQPIREAAALLPLEQRLRLFLQLADAVAYAHRNLLVHRDLKPSNVLVDAEGQVKLLDFGIAKAIDPAEPVGALGGAGAAAGAGPAAESTLTAGGARPFTPEYASPEQVRGEPVTTATDVYSLGVLLYQMLTGTRPTGRGATTPLQMAHSVLTEEPTGPSRLTSAEAKAKDWPSLRRRLEGDLDQIVLKALRKDLSQRYLGVEALAADVLAYLEGRPVSARAPSAVYLTRKFIGRHRWSVVAAAAGTLGMITGLVAALVQGRAAVAVGAVGMAAGLVVALMQARQATLARQRAETEAARAKTRFEDLRSLAHNVLFDYHDLIEPLVGSTPVRQRLLNDALNYLNRLSQDTPQDRKIRVEMGMGYRTAGFVQRNGFRRPHLGDTAGAMQSYERAVAVLQPLVASDASDEDAAFELALAYSAKAGVLADDGDMASAEPLFEQAAALFTHHLPKDTPDLRHRLELARTHFRIASALNVNRQFERAKVATATGVTVLESLAALQPQHLELPHVWVWVHFLRVRTATALGDWATVQRELESNEKIMTELLAQQPHNGRFREDHASTASALMLWAEQQGDLGLVRHWGEQALQRWQRITVRDPDDRNANERWLEVLTAHGQALAHTGAVQEGLEALRSAKAAMEHASQRWPYEAGVQDIVAMHHSTLARFAGLQGDPKHAQEAKEAFHHAQTTARALLDHRPQDPAALTCVAVMHLRQCRSLAQLALQQQDAEAALALHEPLALAVERLRVLRDSGRLLPQRRASLIEETQAVLAQLHSGAGAGP